MSENVELTYQVYDAFNRRDLGAFLALMDADVEAGSRLVAMEGGYQSHDGIRQWWQNLLEWIVAAWRDKKVVRWQVLSTEAEALEAVGLSPDG